MDLYVSRQCQHCAQLLTLLKDNPHLQPYFSIKPIESNPYPKELKVVPTLIKDNQLFTGNELNMIVNDVNRYDMERRGSSPQQQQQNIQQQQQMQQHQQMQQQQQQMPQGNLDEREMQLQQFANKGPQQQQQPQKSSGDDEISGMCLSEGCMFESISNSNDNFLNGDYCFLDDGYSETKPTDSNNTGTGEKAGRFDNNAYEAMMKSRSM